MILLGALTAGTISKSGGLLFQHLTANATPFSGKKGNKLLTEPQAKVIPKKLMSQIDISKAQNYDGKYIQVTPEGSKVFFTIDPLLQSSAKKLLDNSNLLAGAIVAMDVKTGKILAMVEYRSSEYSEETIPVFFSSRHPAASIFKIITAAALLEKNAVLPETTVCYHNGLRKILASHLEDDPKRDRLCATLSFAMGKSINPVFAKLAYKNLSVDELRKAAVSFGFGEEIPLIYSTTPAVSSADIPEDKLEFARTAAGFWHTTLSPLHAAMIAQAVANEGAMMKPIIIEKIEDNSGKIIWQSSPQIWMQSTTAENAKTLTKMMVETVTRGTAKEYFSGLGPSECIQSKEIAGKTGSLSKQDPFRFYSWFTGFAPISKPQIAVSALAVNAEKWTSKGAILVRKFLPKTLPCSRVDSKNKKQKIIQKVRPVDSK